MTGPLAVQAAAESVSRQLAFPGAPPAWVVVLVIVPLLVLFVSAIYRREGEIGRASCRERVWIPV